MLTFVSQILSGAVLLLWVLVASRTALGAWRGTLFYAPCLQNLALKDSETEGERLRA